MTVLLRRVRLLALICVLTAPHLAAQEVPSQPTREARSHTLTLPARLTGELTSASERVELTRANAIRPADRYTITLRAGQTATVRMESTAFDTYLKVLRDGEFHARNDDHDGSRDVSQVTLTSPGAYTILAGAFYASNNLGPYELAVSSTSSTASDATPPESPAAPPPAQTNGVTHTPLTIPSTHRGQIDDSTPTYPIGIGGAEHNADVYTLTLDEGEQVTFRVTMAQGETLPRWPILYFSASDSPTVGQRWASGSEESLEFTLDWPGEFTIYVGVKYDWGGTYTLDVYGGDAPLEPSTPSAPERSQGPPPSTTDDSVRTTLQGTLSDADLEVRYPGLSDNRMTDVYGVELDAGDILVVEMESQDFDTFLAVAYGLVFVAHNDDDGSTQRSRIRYRAESSGEHTIYAGTYTEDGRGRYELTFWGEVESTRAQAREPERSRRGGPGLPLGREGGLYNGELRDTDAEVPLTLADDLRKADAHHVQLNRGETLVVRLESQAFDTYLRMELDGEVVARNDDDGSTSRSQIRFRAPESGVYAVYAGTFTASGRGRYQLWWDIE